MMEQNLSLNWTSCSVNKKYNRNSFDFLVEENKNKWDSLSSH